VFSVFRKTSTHFLILVGTLFSDAAIQNPMGMPSRYCFPKNVFDDEGSDSSSFDDSVLLDDDGAAGSGERGFRVHDDGGDYKNTDCRMM
jgi:hypothetical protein